MTFWEKVDFHIINTRYTHDFTVSSRNGPFGLARQQAEIETTVCFLVHSGLFVLTSLNVNSDDVNRNAL